MNQNHFARFAGWYGAGLTLAYFAFFMLPSRDADNEFHYRKYGQMPAIDGGRLKPMDTVARMNLMVITHRQQWYDPETKKTYPATKWLLDVFTTPLPNDQLMGRILDNEAGIAFDQPVFRIENDEVLNMLGLKMRSGLRYSFAEIAKGDESKKGGGLGELMREATRLVGDEEAGEKGIEQKFWSLKDTKVVELAQHVRLFMRLCGSGTPLVIPEANGGEQWKAFRDYMVEVLGGDVQPGKVDAETFAVHAKLLTHYQKGEHATFNRILGDHLAELEKRSPGTMRAMRTEMFFNDFAPFYRGLAAYAVLAFVAALSWLMPEYGQPLRRAAFAGIIVVVCFHFLGMVLRMYLQNRWFVFVTNLYSSAVFIGLGCAIACLIVEHFFKNGIASVVGGATGFCSLIIAHMLSLDGDTMIMMQAVLDTNFWLATHVTTVTLGYTMAFVAGFMGCAYIFLGMFTNMLRGEGASNLTRMTYGILCGGMFLSFVGTVLGGLWADYSWGRFWGWDPKENGALLIVIWIALILHARWGGMVKQRGIAVLSVLGIIVTSWSWFGTNFLGVGLHAYGGAKSAAMMALIIIDLIFLAIAGLGLLPLENWQSFRPLPAPTPAPKLQATNKAKAMV